MDIVGIDLGTTTSEIAIFRKQAPQMIRDERGDEIILSIVGIDTKTRIMGVGKNFRSGEAEEMKSIDQIKRKMGSTEKVKLGDAEYLPEEISAFILKYLKTAAERYLGKEVTRAVITVPANFTDAARQATLTAGSLAGFVVERIINEPTAAALAYGHSEGLEEEKVLVYDLGGGTFDVSVVEYLGQAVDVLGSGGDPHLGGKDFDELLTAHLIKEIESRYSFKVLPKSPEYYKLLWKAEDAKKELSFQETVKISLPFFTQLKGKPLSMVLEVTRTELEKLIAPLIDRTEKSIEKALHDAKVAREEISQILLVGGSTRIPYVKKLIKRVIGKDPQSGIDPDRAVALGAAIQGAIITGESNHVIMDVCPLSLGTSAVADLGGMIVTGQYSEIIPSNWKVLKSRTEKYRTIYDDQDEVDFRVYQRSAESESPWAEVEGEPNVKEGYTLLGKQQVKLTPGPAGQQIEATYTYNQNGIVEIEIAVPGQSQSTKFSVTSQISADQIKTRAKELDDQWKRSEYYDKVKALISATEKELRKDLDESVRVELEKSLRDLKEALAHNNEELIHSIEKHITNLLFNLDS